MHFLCSMAFSTLTLLLKENYVKINSKLILTTRGLKMNKWSLKCNWENPKNRITFNEIAQSVQYHQTQHWKETSFFFFSVLHVIAVLFHLYVKVTWLQLRFLLLNYLPLSLGILLSWKFWSHVEVVQHILCFEKVFLHLWWLHEESQKPKSHWGEIMDK